MVRQSQPLVDQGDRKGQRRGVKDLGVLVPCVSLCGSAALGKPFLLTGP